MRIFSGLFGLSCGGVLVAFVAMFGFNSADTEALGYALGAMFGAITLASLFFHVVAVRLWRTGHKAASSFILAVAFLALIASFSNAFSALSNRDATKAAARDRDAAVRDRISAQLADASNEKRGIGWFKLVDAGAVEAAQRAVRAAETSRAAECKRRGRRCRKREDNERQALAAFVKIKSQRALTVRASELDQRIEQLQAKLSALAPVISKNPSADAIVALFRIPMNRATWLAHWQEVVMALVFELIVIASLLSWEFLKVPMRPAAAIAPVGAVKVTTVPQLEPPKRPSTVSDLLGNMLQAGDSSIDVSDMLEALEDQCRKLGIQPEGGEDLPTSMARRCKEIGAKVAQADGAAFLKGVKLVN